MKHARSRQWRNPNNRNFKPSSFRSNQPRRTRHRSRRPLPPADPCRALIISRLARRALVDGGIFHLGPHRVQIVRGRDHRKQQNQRTPQRQQYLERIEPASRSRSRAPVPQPISRQPQQHPRQIEKQFHMLEQEHLFSKAPPEKTQVLQKTPNPSQRDHSTAAQIHSRNQELATGRRQLATAPKAPPPPVAPSASASVARRWHFASPPRHSR